jgi:hypothetical protein
MVLMASADSAPLSGICWPKSLLLIRKYTAGGTTARPNAVAGNGRAAVGPQTGHLLLRSMASDARFLEDRHTSRAKSTRFCARAGASGFSTDHPAPAMASAPATRAIRRNVMVGSCADILPFTSPAVRHLLNRARLALV